MNIKLYEQQITGDYQDELNLQLVSPLSGGYACDHVQDVIIADCELTQTFTGGRYSWLQPGRGNSTISHRVSSACRK